MFVFLFVFLFVEKLIYFLIILFLVFLFLIGFIKIQFEWWIIFVNNKRQQQRTASLSITRISIRASCLYRITSWNLSQIPNRHTTTTVARSHFRAVRRRRAAGHRANRQRLNSQRTASVVSLCAWWQCWFGWFERTSATFLFSRWCRDAARDENSVGVVYSRNSTIFEFRNIYIVMF